MVNLPLQNEIFGDLQIEFAVTPEKSEELRLEGLGAALHLQVGYPGTLGKYTSGLLSGLIRSKMSGGFNLSSIRS